MTPTIERIQGVLSHHGTHRSTLVPLLKELDETLGYLPDDALNAVSQHLHLPPAEVRAVATFYHMLSLQPRGRHVVQCCESAPCHIAGGRAIWQALQAALALEAGETSDDGSWAVERISCIGMCDQGPVLLIDGELHRDLTPDQIPDLLARTRSEPT